MAVSEITRELPTPCSLYGDPDVVDYSSEFISEFRTLHREGRHVIASSNCCLAVGGGRELGGDCNINMIKSYYEKYAFIITKFDNFFMDE